MFTNIPLDILGSAILLMASAHFTWVVTVERRLSGIKSLDQKLDLLVNYLIPKDEYGNLHIPPHSRPDPGRGDPQPTLPRQPR